MPPKSQKKKKAKQLEQALSNCHISEPDPPPPSIVFAEEVDPELLKKWPKLKMKVPTIFLHKTIDFAQHVKKILKLGIKFFQPYLGTNYTKIFCHSFNDHRAMLQYFDNNELPYHTFGHPNKRKMRVVIRGLPKDTDLNNLKQEMKSASIPIVRVHQMRMKVFAKDRDMLVLAVVPHDDEGKKLLSIKTVLGHDVKMEPPIPKTKQCHRCQKWGHSQRYCHGQIKCVKCAGDHLSKKCQRDPATEPPTCANCGGNHTASYRECFFCPDSIEYKMNRKKKPTGLQPPPRARELVTLSNCDTLYRKVKYIPKHTEAIPF